MHSGSCRGAAGKPLSNQRIHKDQYERHRLHWCRGCLLFSNAIHRRSLALPLNRQTEHTWSLLLSLRRSPAQLSTITTSYSTFIGQAPERCNLAGNVHPPCSVSCCLPRSDPCDGSAAPHPPRHLLKARPTSRSHVTRPSRSRHPCRRTCRSR